MKNRKLFEIILAVVCALFLWMYVVTVVTPDDDLLIENIPITFAGESALRTENGLIITNRSARSVNVKFHGSRVLLKQLEAEKNNIAAVLDVSQFTSERDYSASYEIILPTLLQRDDIQTLEYSPRVVRFTVEKQAKKQINVKGIFEGTVAEGYVAGDLIFDQDTLLVTGPANLVDQVRSAQVVMSGRDLTRSTTKEIAVTLWGVDAEGQSYQLSSEDLSLSTADIKVTLPVYVEKTLPVTVKPVYGAAENAANTVIEIEPKTVTLLGEPDEIRLMTELSLGELDISKVRDGEVLSIDLPLPNGFVLKNGSSTAKVTVRFNELLAVTAKVSGILMENVPEGMSAECLTEEMEITFRGTQEELQKLSFGQIIVTANLGEYKVAGEYTVPVMVSTSMGKVTAVGNYTARVEMKN